jgi:DNA-directed RNA polymerase specialized sigma24 family protein
MAADNENSVTRWVNDLKAGDRGEAARLLWQRYFEQLARLAQARLRAVARGPADGEDVALSAFDSFFRGVAEGGFPRLADRDDLWKLLTTIAMRKASNRRRREGQRKRGGGRVIGASDYAAGHPGGADPLAEIAGTEPSPELAALLIDEIHWRFADLPDESLRVVALRRLEGHSNAEIAAELDCSLRSVERKLELIRRTWGSEAGE